MRRVSRSPISPRSQPPAASPEPQAGSDAASGATSGAASDAVSDGRSLRAQRLRSERRLQILHVARQLFAQRGYHETSIQDLLDRADIARGTFYLHFDSKRAIFDELVEEFLAHIRSVVRVVDLSPTAPPPLLQIESNLDRIFSVLQQNRDITRITLLMAEGLDAECDAKMADFYGRVLDLLCHALRLGQQMGLVRSCDVNIVAQAALGGLKEVALQWIARRDSSEAELRNVAHEILAYTLHGLFLPPVTRATV